MKKDLILLFVLVLLLLPACAPSAPAETEPPEGLDNAWLEELPWEETWVCVLLGDWAAELEPETGKEALRNLLYSYDWILIDPAAQEAEYLPELGITLVPSGWETQIFLAPKDNPICFHLRTNGDLYWNGTLRRPLGENAGAELRERWKSLMDLGERAASPPRLTLSCGEASIPARLYPGYSWAYMTRMGLGTATESDAARPFDEEDWLGKEDAAVLRAEGDVILSFASREPETMSLVAFTSLGQVPAELRDGRFTPYAGVNAYALSCTWDRVERGGSGSCTYILLVDGDGPRELHQPEYQVSGEILEADAYGCVFALENRENRGLYILENQSTWTKPGICAYSLFRRTESGGLAWIQPQRFIEIDGWIAENSSPLGLDWSYACGALEPGEYVLLLSGSLLSRNNGRPQADFFLPLSFTLGEDCIPEAPGPDALSPVPEGIACTMTQLSPHRWLQTLRRTGEGTVRADRDYSLFRLEENGELDYIPPKYRLPFSLNHPWAVREEDSSIAIDLAAYGGLESGTYVVRRRLYCPAAEEAESLNYHDRSWRTWPKERIRYLDVLIRLDADRPEPDKGVEPMTTSPYAGEETELPLDIRNDRFSAVDCSFRLENQGDLTVSLNVDSARLWFLSSSGDWLPLEIRRHKASGMALFPLAPGEGRDYSYAFTPMYAPLAQGVYRLVLPLTVEGQEEGSWLAVEFRIPEDGTGAFIG